jgi:hypothetical protein
MNVAERGITHLKCMYSDTLQKVHFVIKQIVIQIQEDKSGGGLAGQEKSRKLDEGRQMVWKKRASNLFGMQ